MPTLIYVDRNKKVEIYPGITDYKKIKNIFEKKLANFAGSKYAVSVDNCTDGMFLCLKYLDFKGEITNIFSNNTFINVIIVRMKS